MSLREVLSCLLPLGVQVPLENRLPNQAASVKAKYDVHGLAVVVPADGSVLYGTHILCSTVVCVHSALLSHYPYKRAAY